MARKRVGDTIEVGELLLFTSGEYSSYGVDGLFRARKQFIMPGKQDERANPGYLMPDVGKVTSDPELTEEVVYTEVWEEDDIKTP